MQYFDYKTRLLFFGVVIILGVDSPLSTVRDFVQEKSSGLSEVKWWNRTGSEVRIQGLRRNLGVSRFRTDYINCKSFIITYY